MILAGFHRLAGGIYRSVRIPGLWAALTGKFPARSLLPLLLAATLGLSGCAQLGYDVTDPALPDGRLSRDLIEVPQDLAYFADKAGADTLLLDAAASRKEYERFREAFFAPWAVSRASQSRDEAFWGMKTYTPERGYAENLRTYPQARWDELTANADLDAFPLPKAVHAITVRNTSLRLMPTHTPYFRSPRRAGEGFPFDYFQNSAMWAGTPVAIVHLSADRAWAFVETRFATGWVPVGDVAVVDDLFKTVWRSSPLAALIRDKVALTPESGQEELLREPLITHVGAVFPLVENEPATTVLFPVRLPGGEAGMEQARLSTSEALVMPMPMTPAALADVGSVMMGQPYGWGGLYEDRDCSATLRDLFTPFGVWLPRNSRQQAGVGTHLPMQALSPDRREQDILEKGIPFRSLVTLPGHVGLYLGSAMVNGKEQPVMFHNIWGLRVHLAEKDAQGKPVEARAVIGKAVVTTLRPGAELPGISSPASILDRVTGLTIVP